MRIYIYGVYDDKVCLYVGQTHNLRIREYQHRYHGLMHDKCRIRVFRDVPEERASTIEDQIIKAMVRKGQATRNRSKYGRDHRRVQRVKRTVTITPETEQWLIDTARNRGVSIGSVIDSFFGL